MTVNEFLHELERNLSSLKPEERQSAMAYYREYLEEAGDSAQEAIENLGSPQSVAERILSESELELNESKKSQPKSKISTIIAGSFILLATSPFWLVILFLWLALVFALTIIVLTFATSIVIAPIQGIMYLTKGLFGDGIGDIGAGLFCAGITMLIWRPCLKLIIHTTKTLWGHTVAICRKLFGKENIA
ncbi:MAG: DUF1700 domain-containing protein [Oscillospiraceae bacterium]|nr:DUF1700 domain-containing protein [Oscillospiraceae bacterium]